MLIVQSREAQPACRFDPTISGCFTGSNGKQGAVMHFRLGSTNDPATPLPRTVVQTLMAVLIGAFALGQVGPNFAAFAAAQTAGALNLCLMTFGVCIHIPRLPSPAAFKLFEIIDRVPGIDSSSEAGARPPVASLTGSIEFRNVTFAYPSRPTEVILRNFSLVVKGGTHVALVGESGSGKSTLLALVQRLYDPTEGSGEGASMKFSGVPVSLLTSVPPLSRQFSLTESMSASGMCGTCATASGSCRKSRLSSLQLCRRCAQWLSSAAASTIELPPLSLRRTLLTAGLRMLPSPPTPTSSLPLRPPTRTTS